MTDDTLLIEGMVPWKERNRDKDMRFRARETTDTLNTTFTEAGFLAL